MRSKDLMQIVRRRTPADGRQQLIGRQVAVVWPRLVPEMKRLTTYVSPSSRPALLDGQDTVSAAGSPSALTTVYVAPATPFCACDVQFQYLPAGCVNPIASLL